MNRTIEDLWDDVLAALRPDIDAESYDLWFRPLRALALEGERFVVQIPNAFFADWMREHYQPRLEALLQERCGQTVSLTYSVLKPVEELIKKHNVGRVQPTSLPSASKTMAPPQAPQETYLNPRSTFDSFVVGNS